MDPTTTIEPPNTQSNGHKRPSNNSVNDNFKRRRFGGEMKRVAEIALVLSAMSSIRGGGKKPSEAEVALMIHARRKLIEICEGFAPMDVVRRDSVARVIEDLGLDSGCRGSKLSVAERLEVSTGKMEESKKFLAHTTTYTSQPLQANVSPSTAVENVSAVPAYQITTSEVKTTMSSSGVNSSRFGPRVEGAQFKVEGGSNGGTFYSSQLRASSPASHMLVNAPPWSVQQPSASSTNSNYVNVGATNGISMPNTFSQGSKDQNIRPFIAQNTPANLPCNRTVPGMNVGQAPSPYNPHVEIARTVQKLLQPNLPEHHSWIPPSRDYMNNAITCQICKAATNEVSTLLVCDACDKGYQIKCIKLVNQNGVPSGEWHCQRCLILSNGKPLPPKIGRVTRSTNTIKVPSCTTGAQVSQEKKVAGTNSNVAQQKIIANENSAIQRPTDSIAAGKDHVELALDSKVSSSGEGLLNNVSDKSGETSGAHFGPVVGSSVVRSIQHNQNLPLSTNERVSLSEIKSEPLANPISPTSSNKQNSDRIKMPNPAEDPEDFSSAENTIVTERTDARQDDQVPNVAGPGPSDHSGLSSDDLQAVEWVGDSLEVVNGKKIYQSCCISGVIYTVHNYALFRLSPDKSTPSKLQAMWEDIKTGSKWLIVRKCYFPGDGMFQFTRLLAGLFSVDS